MQNSNPTILTDLPSRQPATPSHQTLYDGDIFGGAGLNPLPPHILGSSAGRRSPFSTLDSDEDEDLAEDPIDEQEIYGMSRSSFASPSSAAAKLPKIFHSLTITNAQPQT